MTLTDRVLYRALVDLISQLLPEQVTERVPFSEFNEAPLTVRADGEQLQCQSTLVRLLSITESIAAELLLRETDQVVGRASSVAADVMWDEAGVRVTRTLAEYASCLAAEGLTDCLVKLVDAVQSDGWDDDVTALAVRATGSTL